MGRGANSCLGVLSPGNKKGLLCLFGYVDVVVKTESATRESRSKVFHFHKVVARAALLPRDLQGNAYSSKKKFPFFVTSLG